MTVCNRCREENQDHYKFCLGCGAELTAKPGDMAMMKTMMADPSQAAPLPGAPLAGAGPMRGSSSQIPQPGGPMRPAADAGMPPSRPLGSTGMNLGNNMGGGMPQPMVAWHQPPMGPPPGVTGFSPGFAPQQLVAAPTMRRCPSCGSDVPPSFRFCGSSAPHGRGSSAPNPMPMQQPAPTAAPQRRGSR